MDTGEAPMPRGVAICTPLKNKLAKINLMIGNSTISARLRIDLSSRIELPFRINSAILRVKTNRRGQFHTTFLFSTNSDISGI
jgi:hypothetical protein